ncbi:MAG TPA: cupin domain-containing protein [Solirubrobacteraceae bacterium]|nr:cupin domain-containing protein [Solirubrobacteraceae bacterium]
MSDPRPLSPEGVRAAFPVGTVAHNPVTGEYVRVIEQSAERSIGEMVAVPGGAVAGPHHHPDQTEHFEVLEGVLGYRRGDDRGTLTLGESMTVAPGIVHDWWNAGDGNLRARITVSPPGLFAAMIGAVWGLGVLGRTNAKGMPGLLDAALLAEAFGNEMVFERPPRPIQRALVTLIAPIARRRGHSVTGDDVVRAAIVSPDPWPAATGDVAG